MIIYTTLKQNRANDVDFVEYCDECFTQVGGLFGEEYVDEYDYTDWDKLWNDFTDKQIESRVLKFLKEDAKDKEEGLLFKYEKILIDRELAYDDCVAGVKAGILKASDLRDIDRKSKKYGFSFVTSTENPKNMVSLSKNQIMEKMATITHIMLMTSSKNTSLATMTSMENATTVVTAIKLPGKTIFFFLLF